MSSSATGALRSPQPPTIAPRVMRPIELPIRFAIGARRFLSVPIRVTELTGHFLESPVRLGELVDAHVFQSGRTAVFGRSIVASHDELLAASALGIPLRVLGEYNRSYVTLRGTSVNGYLAKFSSRSRSTLMRKVRKLEQAHAGAIDWSTFRHPADVSAFLSEALPLSALTYQHRRVHAGLPSTEAFRERMETLAGENRFRGWILRLNGKAIAYICSEIVGGTVLYDYVGFDPAHGDLSPGTVLQYLVLAQLFETGEFEYFDFTEGEGSHKQFFETGSRHCADVVIPGSALGPRALIAAQRVFAEGVRSASAALEGTSVKARVREFLRGL